MGSIHPGFLTQYGSDAPDAHTPHYGDASAHQGTVFQITKDLTVTQEGLQIGQKQRIPCSNYSAAFDLH